MHLKSLYIVGFKSFADETTIEFDPGFTAVVGPNGCGKSNLLDSVKWVFGEKSAKGLRGEKMDDVIFHGSETRRPSGFAEVSILFDNSDRFFPVDFPSFRITRRLYPDGENEYYINDIRVTRKEVEKALLDTGLGKTSYSIMEQGKVDQLLNSKPEERRFIFEEAAGITRFRVERKEALKKLEDTQKNLDRIGDILYSMQKEMEVKEKQSEKAEIYFRFRNEMHEADKNLRYLKLSDFKARLFKYEKDLAEIKEKNSEIMSQISKETEEIENLEQKKQILEKESLDIDSKLREHFSKTQVHKEKIGKNRELTLEFESRIQEYNQTESNEMESLSRIFREIEELDSQIESILGENQVREDHLRMLLEKRDSLKQDLETEQAAIRSREDELKKNDMQILELRESMKDVIQELVRLLEARKKDAEGKEEERLNLRAKLLHYLEEYADRIETAKEILQEGQFQEAYKTLARIDFREFYTQFQIYMDLDDHFRSMFLDKGGVLAKKEELDFQTETLISVRENLTKLNQISLHKVEEIRGQIQDTSECIVEMEKRILENSSLIRNLEEKKKHTRERIQEIESRLKKLSESKEQLILRKSEFEKEIQLLEKEIENSYKEFLSMSEALNSTKENLKKIQNSIQELRQNISKNQEAYRELFPILTEKEKNISAIKVQIDSINEELYNDYSMTDVELENERKGMQLSRTQEEIRLRNAKFEIQQLGSINPLAIEEYKNLKELYEHHKSQKEDIEASKRDIETILENINQESEALFLETFEKIRENFQETFSTLFQGGRATLELTEKEDSLNSGIEILAEPPGKHVQNLRLLSGGEKSLTAIALLFAIYMVKPSPFCFLDEIDAALDEANKLRFCAILDKFKDKTQFIVISHAQSTISRANAIFGVTNEEPGVSKLVSLKLDDTKAFAQRSRQALAS